ncbi:conserved hypothetical protein [Paecilomyces variotii No. 5]|uniref:Large ribosomal subunit protein mL54 n=1 Tax=Byssochlamys spectabilis (strain No. 5 / NBRC 109023) TaxID=1356009 RepID=V5G5G9_BYSSN|nr:conserved hypothetical protein [Paecilomyces variotii No. 5]
MICRQCRTSLLSRLVIQSPTASTCSRPIQRGQLRNYSLPGPPPAPRQPGPSEKPITVPSAISSASPGISQPLSTPEGVHVDVNPEKPKKPATQREPSSCPPGTKLQGLNYFKNKPDLFALDDSEYPDWLWGLLDEKKQSKTEMGGVDVSTLNKKQRKRHEKKMAALAASLPRKIPIHEQATDITPAPYNRTDGSEKDIITEAAESLEKRSEITKSARAARRKGIREANFLRGL